MDTKWHPDPLISENIEKKRTELQILFANKVEQWLVKYPKKSVTRDYLIAARLVLTDKVKKLSMIMLEPLERMLHKNFSTRSGPVDLSSDDDDVQFVEVTHLPAIEKKSLDAKPMALQDASPEIIIDDSDDEVAVRSPPHNDSPASSGYHSPVPCIIDSPARRLEVSPKFEALVPRVDVTESTSPTRAPQSLAPTVQAAQSSSIASLQIPQSPAPTFQVPLPQGDAPSLDSLDLTVPENDVQATTSSATKQRRKSVNSRPNSSKDLPSIADYKIKTSIPPPGSIYAKSAEEAPKVRQIISVPYKNPVRKPQEDYDPKKEAQKLAGVTEKIVGKYFDQMMQKKLEEEKLAKENEEMAKDSSDSSDDDEKTPLANRKQKPKSNPGTKRRQANHKDGAQPMKRPRGRPKKDASQPSTSKYNNSSREKAASEKKKAVPVSKPVAKSAKKKKPSPLDSSDGEGYVAPSHVLDPIDADLQALNGIYNPPRWDPPTPSTSNSLNTSAETTTSNLSDDLIHILSSSKPLPIDSKQEEADRRAVLEQSFNEDDLLVEIAVDPKKDRKPRRTTRFVPRSPQRILPKRGRGRPRRSLPTGPPTIKEEPVSSD